MKRFFSFIAITVVLVLTPFATPAKAAPADTVLRVGLAYGSGALQEARLENVDATGYTFGSFSGKTFVPETSVPDKVLTMTQLPNGSIQAVNTDTGAVLYTSQPGKSLAIRPNSRLTWFKGYKYYGDFLYVPGGSNKVTVINYVMLEDYVKGVLPYEMSASWNREALKAQAVCARSYAMTNLNKHAKLGFDLCNTTNCQVYKGAGRANDNSNAAADETAGLVLYSGGRPATGFFFSSDGGATEDNENVWGGDPLPYLRGVRDPYEDTASAPNGVWEVRFTPAQATAKLQSSGYKIGQVADIKITKRTAMDNVNQVVVTDTSGKSITINRGSVRTAFGLNSIRYSINGSGGGGGNVVPPEIPDKPSGSLYINGSPQPNAGLHAISGNGSVIGIGSATGKTALTANGTETIVVGGSSARTVSAPSSEFVFTGSGWGHNIGMSQCGALGMAKQGFTFDQILKFYFTGIQIAK